MIHTFETLPTWNFFKISDTGDKKYLLKDWETNQLLPEKGDDLWDEMVEKYNEITGDGKNVAYQNDKTELLTLRNRYIILNNAIKALTIVYDEEIVTYLRKSGYKYDKDNQAESLENLIRQMAVLEKKIGIKQAEYISRYCNETEHKQDIYELVCTIEKVRKMPIDVMTIPIIKFAYYIKDLKAWQTAE